jgi:hypothetical protein
MSAEAIDMIGIPQKHGGFRHSERNLCRVLWRAQASKVGGGSRAPTERRAIRDRSDRKVRSVLVLAIEYWANKNVRSLK